MVASGNTILVRMPIACLGLDRSGGQRGSDFDMVDATPYNANAIEELYEACLAEGLEFGVY